MKQRLLRDEYKAKALQETTMYNNMFYDVINMYLSISLKEICKP
jgi:hypothetical protein